ncbi:MAG: NFACT RNA binding domain-containing protein [Candidatus Diapherotrites archaeon]
MKVTISLGKTLQQNASDYFGKSKKAKKKLAGLEKAVLETEKKLAGEMLKAREIKTPEKKRKKEWHEKFHWFISSDGFLVIGGRDAKSNEDAVKKHMDKNDLYFHAEIQGAPHTIVKSGGKKVPGQTKKEAAQFAAAFSSAWKSGSPAVDVYSVKPEQVSKSAPSGESLGTGAFMIYGEREWFRKTPIEFAIGLSEKNGEYIVISGPPSAVRKHTKNFATIKQGMLPKGAAAKRVAGVLKGGDLDELLAMLPSGGIEVIK